MSKQTNMFQQLVELLEHHLAPAGTKVTGSALLADMHTGEKREVDILIEATAGAHPVRVGVEVIDRGRKASSPWIESIAKKHEHLPIDKTIVVSRSGFYEPALAKAAVCKIDAITLGEASRIDWQSKIGAIPRVTIDTFLMPHLTGCTVIFKEERSFQSFASKEPTIVSLELFTAKGESRDTLSAFAQRLVADPNFVTAVREHAFLDTGTAVECEIPLQTGTYLMTAEGERHEVVRIGIKAKCERSVVGSTLIRGQYRDAAVLLSSGKSLGRPVDMVFTETRDGTDPRVSIQIGGVQRLAEGQSGSPEVNTAEQAHAADGVPRRR